jgi:hypothetical protein
LQKAGVLLALDGLKPLSTGARVSFAGGKPKVIDGPFTEAKEVIGGYAMFQLHSKEEAVEQARRFLQVHADNWPGVQATCEIRQVMDADPGR